MKKRTMAIIAAAAVVVASFVGAGIAFGQGGSGDDDDATDVAITGEALERASEAALAHLGEGTVTETEIGDEDSLYEVEVTLDDGRQIDVQLDENFEVVGADEDTDDASDDD